MISKTHLDQFAALFGPNFNPLEPCDKGEQEQLITYCNARGKIDLSNALREHWDSLRVKASIAAERGK